MDNQLTLSIFNAMSELFPASEVVTEPDWLKQARRRNAPYAAIGDNDFAPAVLDRRALLKAYDELAQQHQEAVARAEQAEAERDAAQKSTLFQVDKRVEAEEKASQYYTDLALTSARADGLAQQLAVVGAAHKVEVLDILRDMRLPVLEVRGTPSGRHQILGRNAERKAINFYCNQKAYEYDPEGIGPDPTEVGQWDTRKLAATPPLEREAAATNL